MMVIKDLFSFRKLSQSVSCNLCRYLVPMQFFFARLGTKLEHLIQ